MRSIAVTTPVSRSQVTGVVDETCWTDADEPGLAVYRRSKVLAERFIASSNVLWFGEIAEILRTHLGADAARVPTEALPDDDFRALAQVSPPLATLLPLLGRALQHSPAKVQRMLGWRPRPAVETIVDSARCILAALD